MSEPISEAPALFDLAEVFDALPDAWLILDAGARVVAVNRAYLSLVATERAELVGRSIYEVNQTGSVGQRNDRRRWLDGMLEGIAASESRQSPVIRYDMAREGEAHRAPRYWQANATPLRTARGEPLIGLCVHDVTQRMEEEARGQRERAKLRSQARLRQVLVEEANEQLRQQHEQLQHALAFASVGAWELEPHTRTFICNDQFKALLGLPVAATITENRLFDELIDEEYRERVRAAFDEARVAEAPVEVDFRITSPNRRRRWILLRATRTRHGETAGPGAMEATGTGDRIEAAPQAAAPADTRPASLIGLALDISMRKESELEHQANAEAERRARERSEEATRAMDHFVAAVSHELRSPLGAIQSWATLLQRSGDLAHMARAGTVIERNARQLALMVDDLLDSGAIATGKLSIDLAPVDLGALAGNIAEDMRMRIEEKGVRLVADDLNSCIVMADEKRLRQVIWNLMTNALKFCEAGLIEVSVREAGEHAELRVRDTGRGIAPDVVERIFERFYQASDDGQGPRAAGLGLGLWLARSIVRLHGGTIRAQSAGKGLGATFTVQLPRYR
ncbi:sensor histidine kinase [Paraburkholderia acidisoli]|uniref:histidine kinase n=1 Tax=Paraburkholderia acidisoli TaxID=2571748 RepID=A0A7Z2GS53_9BURK|nr:ATP-binding protein [Paraburkholderia acidisoli]QGZ66791.1 PAS domain-containing protein [Paraburkholderia acidisoli]